MKTKEYEELKTQLEEIKKMVETLYKQFIQPQPQSLSHAKVYSIKQKARKKALEIRKRFNLE